MKRNKGFTLIELLGVLTVLAVISLIVIPIMSGTINKARIAARERSIDLYGRAVETALMEYKLTHPGVVLSTVDISDLDIDYKGSTVLCDTVTIRYDGTIYLANCTVGGKAVQDKTYGKAIGCASWLAGEAPEGAVNLEGSGEYFYELWSTENETAYLAKYNLNIGIKYTYDMSVIVNSYLNGIVDSETGLPVGMSVEMVNLDSEDFASVRQSSQSRGKMTDYLCILEDPLTQQLGEMTDEDEINEASIRLTFTYLLQPSIGIPFVDDEEENDGIYWMENDSLKAAYTPEAGKEPYVFDSNHFFNVVLGPYATYLTNSGIDVEEIRLLNIEEAVDVGCTFDYSKSEGDCHDAPNWLNYTTFWLGNAHSSNAYYIENFDIFHTDELGSTNYGIRPVIIVSNS